MAGTPKDEIVNDEPCPPETDEASWSEDQKRRQYYYDDAHGYEVYKDDDEEKEDAD